MARRLGHACDGTYLAACVFYASILGQSPEGLGERARPSGDDAAILQVIAARTGSGPGLI